MLGDGAALFERAASGIRLPRAAPGGQAGSGSQPVAGSQARPGSQPVAGSQAGREPGSARPARAPPRRRPGQRWRPWRRGCGI